MTLFQQNEPSGTNRYIFEELNNTVKHCRAVKGANLGVTFVEWISICLAVNIVLGFLVGVANSLEQVCMMHDKFRVNKKIL
jgi:hypothetical protein